MGVQADAGKQSEDEECGFNVSLRVLRLRPSLHPEMSCQRNSGVNRTELFNGRAGVKS
jgi:hypothetical protein